MIWPFSRNAKPSERGPLKEDWRAGDLAQCLAKTFNYHVPGAPAFMDVCRVESVVPGVHLDGTPSWGLTFRGVPFAYEAREFRKLPPRSERVARKTSVSTTIRERVPA